MIALEALPGLSPAESQIVLALRELPEGSLKRRLVSFLDELADLVRHPGCPEMQADGVPCVSATASCEECRQLAVRVDLLRAALDRN